ncbi:MAG: DUF3800 domain-containing protein [Bacteroidetes bacterium]|nr:DUF3800 domain-containing protein [Bacteroidota bacterium]MBU2584349.1 DUF3800 domain-containing protein [Bacteroidota bacterium]
MSYIFLDESGDLGFDFSKSKTSKNFLITFLFIENKRPIEKIVKTIIRSLKKKSRKHHSGTLHANKEKPEIKKKLLQLLADKDIRVISIYLNKLKVYTRLQDEKHVLYNYVANILLDRVYTKKLIPIDKVVHLIASKRETNKFLNQNFKNYLQQKTTDKHKVKLNIEVKYPSEEKCLQAVDFICWSIFRKREFGDDTYYKIIKEKIFEESGLFI